MKYVNIQIIYKKKIDSSFHAGVIASRMCIGNTFQYLRVQLSIILVIDVLNFYSFQFVSNTHKKISAVPNTGSI